jgi:hypothetical protein
VSKTWKAYDEELQNYFIIFKQSYPASDSQDWKSVIRVGIHSSHTCYLHFCVLNALASIKNISIVRKGVAIDGIRCKDISVSFQINVFINPYLCVILFRKEIGVNCSPIHERSTVTTVVITEMLDLTF